MKAKICDILENIFDFLWVILKWTMLPFCIVLMIIKNLKNLKRDLKMYIDYEVSSPISIYDGKLEYNNFHPGRLRTLLKLSLNNPNQYLLDEIPSDWCDKPEMLRDIMYSMIIDMVEGEKCFETVYYFDDIEDPGSDHGRKIKKTGIEIKKLYNIIKIYRTDPDKIINALNLLYKINKEYAIKIVFGSNVDVSNVIDAFNLFKSKNLELFECDNIDNIIIKRIVRIRDYLWT